MKKTLIALAVSLLAAMPQEANAEGYLRPGGKSLVESGRTADLRHYLLDICGVEGTSEGAMASLTVPPKNNVGDVYFVGVNDAWIGEKSRPLYPYTQINKGVSLIDKVKDECKQKTASGAFYTYDAKNANKFFFIVRRATLKPKFAKYPATQKSFAFVWYDEWSYAKKNEDGVYEPLKSSWNDLCQGTPYPSPHNCDTSLDSNHFISMCEQESDDEIPQHYNFTAYLYIPDNAVEDATSASYAVPYVFLYKIRLNEGQLEKKTPAPASENGCRYNVNLNWSTVFDKFASDPAEKNTNYDTMKEHFVIQRSYDMSEWSDLEDAVDVNGNSVKTTAEKITTDKGLKDYDETTKEIGYPVYYRVVSYVQKKNGTQMSVAMSNVVTVNVPGSSPFVLSLMAGGTSKYNPGQNGTATNTFCNTLVAQEAASHEPVALVVGAQLTLVRVDGENPTGKTLATVSMTKDTMTLSDLVEQIGFAGEFTESFTTPAGDKKDASYQLVLTVPNGSGEPKVYRSNIVTLVNLKNDATAVKVHRSGTPDTDTSRTGTCAGAELFRNDISFAPATVGVGCGYNVYRDGEIVANVVDNGDGTFSLYGESGVAPLVDGEVTVTDYVEADPMRVGENTVEAGGAEKWNYAVAHYDARGNSYGSKDSEAKFDGSMGELVVNVTGATKSGYSYAEIVSTTDLSWSRNVTTSDVNVLKYVIYRSFDGGAYEMVGQTAGTTYTDSKKYNRAPQTSGNWVNKPVASEYKSISYYVKEVVNTDEMAQNMIEKNSNVLVANVMGNVFTGVEGVDAESSTVTAANGIITVTGASGAIEVYDVSGALVVKTNGNGGVTEIDATSLAPGAYVVKAANANPTKILIK